MKILVKLAAYCKKHHIPYEHGVPLGAHCTFRIGGAAALWIEPSSEAEIIQVCAQSSRLGLSVLVLGKGSNILFPDAGYPGVILHLGSAMHAIRRTEHNTIVCESGASLSRLCLFACEQGLAGLEFAYGIPGSVGGAIYMNAGAYGGEMKDVLRSSRHIHPDGTVGQFTGEAMALSYRHSAYTAGDNVITEGTFCLHPDDPAAIRARMEDYMERRRSKQPLDYPSAGSTFKRPQGAYASALIDECGLKGYCIGDAQVSEKHAGFIINKGAATAKDVKALIAHVQQEVQKQTGYFLHCEVQIV